MAVFMDTGGGDIYGGESKEAIQEFDERARIAAVRAHDEGSDGAALITAERSRQITVEGWTPQHDDDEHESGDLARAALCYLTCGLNQSRGVGQQKTVPLSWPWAKEWWKPSDDPVRNMVKAGALIAAEIDLQKRKAPPASHAAESVPQPEAPMTEAVDAHENEGRN